MIGTKIHRIEVGEDPKFQEASWKAQRFGFIVMLAFVIAGTLGLFGGGGPLAGASAESEGVKISFDRFIRFDTGTEITIRVSEQSAAPLVIELGRDLARDLRIDQIFPPPRSVSAENDGAVYSFDPVTAPGGVVTISAAPKRVGLLDAKIRVNGTDVVFRQFAYP